MRHVLAVVLLCVSAAAWADDIQVSASLSSPRAGLDDIVELKVTVKGASGDVKTPSLPALQGLKIYGGPYTSHSTQIVNFDVTKSVIYSWRLNPLEKGTLTIPSLSVQVGKTLYKTRPLELEVVEGSVQPRQQGRRPQSLFDDVFGQTSQQPSQPRGEIRVRVLPSKRRVYVGEQVTLTYEILTQVNIRDFSIDQMPSYTGFWVESMKRPESIEGDPVEIDGKQFHSFKVHRDILFPTSAGNKTVEEATLRILVLTGGRGFFDLASPQELIRKTAPVTIEVLPLPEKTKPEGYGGAVGAFKVRSDVDKEELQAGDALAYRFTVEGRGNLKTLSPPEFPLLPDCKVYDPRLDEDISSSKGVLSGRKTWEWVIVPQSAMDLEIPPITYSVFDVGEGNYRTLASGSRKVKVTPGKALQNLPVMVGGGEEVRQLGKDIAFISTSDAPLKQASTPLYLKWWYGLLLLAPFVANLSLLIYLKQREKISSSRELFRMKKAGGKAARRLKAARKAEANGDTDLFYRTLRQALVGLVADKLSRSEEGLNIEEIGELLREREVPDHLLSDFKRLITACDSFRYAPGMKTPDAMSALLGEARKLAASLERIL